MASFQLKSAARPVVSVGLRGLYRVGKIARRVLQPITVGVRGLVRDTDQRVLLVRHTYRDGWYFPGGGAARGETLSEAVSREVREEVGIHVEGVPRLFSAYTNFAEGHTDHVVLFIIDRFRQTPSQSFEIAEHRFFPLDDLPDLISAATFKRLKEVFDNEPPSDLW